MVREWAGARQWREQVAGRQAPPAAVRGEVVDEGCGGVRACVWERMVNLVEKAGGAA